MNTLRFREGHTAFLCPHAIARHLGVTTRDLARACNVHRNTLVNAPHGPKVQNALRELLQILSMFESRVGEDNGAFFFINWPSPGFDRRSGWRVCLDGERAMYVHLLLADVTVAMVNLPERRV